MSPPRKPILHATTSRQKEQLVAVQGDIIHIQANLLESMLRRPAACRNRLAWLSPSVPDGFPGEGLLGHLCKRQWQRGKPPKTMWLAYYLGPKAVMMGRGGEGCMSCMKLEARVPEVAEKWRALTKRPQGPKHSKRSSALVLPAQNVRTIVQVDWIKDPGRPSSSIMKWPAR